MHRLELYVPSKPWDVHIVIDHFCLFVGCLNVFQGNCRSSSIIEYPYCTGYEFNAPTALNNIPIVL